MQTVIYEISSDIPLPRPRSHDTSAIAQTLDALEIGQSFFVPNRSSSQVSGWFKNRKPKKFVTRRVFENDIKGIRIWRLM